MGRIGVAGFANVLRNTLIFFDWFRLEQTHNKKKLTHRFSYFKLLGALKIAVQIKTVVPILP